MEKPTKRPKQTICKIKNQTVPNTIKSCTPKKEYMKSKQVLDNLQNTITRTLTRWIQSTKPNMEGSNDHQIKYYQSAKPRWNPTEADLSNPKCGQIVYQ